MFRTLAAFITGCFALSACTETVSRGSDARILTMGDSLLAANGLSGRSVSDSLEDELKEPVVDRSVAGARVIYKLPLSGSAGLNISKQFRPGKWDWIVLNGGGNDLWLGCGCHRCDQKIEKLITEDGAGEIPDLILSLRQTGAKVIYVGYLRSPGVPSPIDSCKPIGDELEARLTKFAATDKGVYFVSLQDLVPHGDRSFHGLDMIHPSIKASTAIGKRIASVING